MELVALISGLFALLVYVIGGASWLRSRTFAVIDRLEIQDKPDRTSRARFILKSTYVVLFSISLIVAVFFLAGVWTMMRIENVIEQASVQTIDIDENRLIADENGQIIAKLDPKTNSTAEIRHSPMDVVIMPIKYFVIGSVVTVFVVALIFYSLLMIVGLFFSEL